MRRRRIREALAAGHPGDAVKFFLKSVGMPAFLITLVSLPAVSAPAGLARDGLPVGIQIVAQRFEEPKILSLASLLQRQSNVGWPPVDRLR